MQDGKAGSLSLFRTQANHKDWEENHVTVR